MATPKHRIQAGGTYFVTTQTWQRTQVFRTAALTDLVEEAIFRYRDQGSYSVHRHVIMPDHVHLILTPGDTTTLEKSVQLIKGGSSREIGKLRGPRFPIWQPGFTEHQIRDQQDFDSHVEYIDQNPVRARLSESAEGYSWGSLAGKFKLDPWPVASGAKAPSSKGTNTAGLKPRPSESKPSEAAPRTSSRSGRASSNSSQSESLGKVGK